jgi:peptidyl-prolyl cis-trans isomerase D
MFDLFRSRQKTVRLMLGGLLVVVSLSMLTYLIPSFNSGTSDPTDQVVAQIGKWTLSQDEVLQSIDRTMRGRQIPNSVIASYVPQVINEMITLDALAYQAEQLGFQVSDAEVQDYIRQVFPQLFPDGKFVGTDAYAALLSQESTTIPVFEAQVRRQLLVSRMRDVALAGTVVTQGEIAAAFHRKEDKIKVEWVKLTSDKYKAEAQPSKEDEEAYFKVNAAKYTIPEKRDITVIVADPAKLEEGLTPAQADLERLYAQNKASFLTPERVRVRHILLKTQGKPAEEDAKMKAKADDLLKQIKAGANFSDLAKKNSEDTASANNAKDPGELSDWITRGQTVPEFERAAFSLKLGQTSDVVKTQYGYHILQVLAHEDAHQRTLDEAKAELTTQWKKQRVNDQIGKIEDKAQADLQKDPAHAGSVAVSYGMDGLRVQGWEPSQPLPGVGLNPDFAQAVSALKVNEVTPPVGVDNKVAFAVVNAVIPSRPATFAEAESQIKETLLQTRTANALQKHAQELADAARKSYDLIKTAKSLGLDAKTSTEFNRTGTIDGLGSASYLEDAFSRSDGSIIGPIGMPDGTAVVRVVGHTPGDMSKLPEQLTSIRDEVKRQKESDRNTVFDEGVRDALTKSGKIKIHQGVVQRIISRYSSAS